MIMVFNKKKVIAAACLLVLCAGLTGAGYQMFGSKSAFLPTENKTVIIDAGHAAHRQYHNKTPGRKFCTGCLAVEKPIR